VLNELALRQTAAPILGEQLGPLPRSVPAAGTKVGMLWFHLDRLTSNRRAKLDGDYQPLSIDRFGGERQPDLARFAHEEPPSGARGRVAHAGRGGLLDTDILATPWGWMVAAE